MLICKIYKTYILQLNTASASTFFSLKNSHKPVTFCGTNVRVHCNKSIAFFVHTDKSMEAVYISDGHGLKEEVAVETVDVTTYVAFIKAAGGLGIVGFALFLHLLAAGSLVFSDWWLSQWIKAMVLTWIYSPYCNKNKNIKALFTRYLSHLIHIDHESEKVCILF